MNIVYKILYTGIKKEPGYKTNLYPGKLYNSNLLKWPVTEVL
jgi:hypothetical protein